MNDLKKKIAFLENKLAETKDELNSYKEKFNLLYLSNELNIIIFDSFNGKIIDANPAACSFYGYKKNDFLDKNIYEISFLSEDEINNCINLVLENKKKFFQLSHQLSDGSLKEIELFCSLFKKHNNKTYIFCIIHDITEKKCIKDNLKISEMKYKKLFNNINDAVFVHEVTDEGAPGKFIEINDKALGMVKYSKKELLNMTPMDMNFHNNNNITNIMKKLFKEKNAIFEGTFLSKDNKKLEVEVNSHLFKLENKNTILSIVKDITNKKNEQKKITNMQKERLEKHFPLPKKADINVIYKPANIISGDFYHFIKINDYTAVGIIADISGKGVSAALSISALKILFSDYVYENDDPKKILEFLNHKVKINLENEFIAALVFRFDFKKMQAKIAAAGLNKFIFKHNAYYCIEELIHGHFLGMFNRDNFEEKIIDFNFNDEFHFYTDGFERNINQQIIFDNFNNKVPMKNKINYLRRLISTLKLKDDCTWLAFKIK